jgi:hypothetical protein
MILVDDTNDSLVDDEDVQLYDDILPYEFDAEIEMPRLITTRNLKSPNFDLASNPNNFILIVPGYINGSLARNIEFAGTVTIPVPQPVGTIYRPPNFTGNLLIPVPVVIGDRTGRSSDEVIFMDNNPNPNYNNPSLDEIITIVNSSPYNPSNPINGNDLIRSLTTRGYDLGNRLKPNIEPQIQTMMTGRIKTFITTFDGEDISYNISLSWKIPTCNDVTNLIGLIYFEQIRLVVGDTTYLVVLLDDLVQVINASRTHQMLTLNFQGRKLNPLKRGNTP